jgi:hypothetical protein
LVKEVAFAVLEPFLRLASPRSRGKVAKCAATAGERVKATLREHWEIFRKPLARMLSR